MQRPGFVPWVEKIPWRREWQPTPVLLPGKSHGWRSLVGYSPWGCKELDSGRGEGLSCPACLVVTLSPEVISRCSEPGEASVRYAPGSPPKFSPESSYGHPRERHHFSWPCGSAGTRNPRVRSGFPQGQELEDLRAEDASPGPSVSVMHGPPCHPLLTERVPKQS